MNQDGKVIPIAMAEDNQIRNAQFRDRANPPDASARQSMAPLIIGMILWCSPRTSITAPATRKAIAIPISTRKIHGMICFIWLVWGE